MMQGSKKKMTQTELAQKIGTNKSYISKIENGTIEPGVLNALNADVLICGGIGGGAQTALAAAGIKLFGGVSGDADEAVEAFINETLEYNPDVKCSHHEHNHGEGHTCGEHGCGSHSCH